MIWANDMIIFPKLKLGLKISSLDHSKLYELGFALAEDDATGDKWLDGHWIFPLSAHEQYRAEHPYRPKRKKG